MPLLDDGVPRERHAHETHDQLAVVRGLASRGSLLRESYLGEQRPNGWDRAEPLQPLARALEEGVAGRRVARHVTKCGNGRDVRVAIRVLEREVSNPAPVGRYPSVDLDGEDEPADRGRREDRAPHHLGRRRAGRVRELEVARLVAVGVLAHVGRVHDELDLRCRERRAELLGRSNLLGDGVGERVVVEASRETAIPRAVGTHRPAGAP